MSDIIETYEHEGFTAEIYYDGDVECPREYMLTHIITPGGRGTRRYTIDDRRHELQAAFDELDRRAMGELFSRYVSIFHPKYLATPCFMYDHGNVHLSIRSYLGRAEHASWDSGMIGWAVIESVKGMNAPMRMDAELDTLSEWMNGETYRYIVEDPDGHEVDGCGGFIGFDYVEEGAVDTLHRHAERAPKQLELDLT